MITDFILEKFKFEEDFKIPPVKNINAEVVIDIYEGMRNFSLHIKLVLNKQPLPQNLRIF